MLQKIVRIIGGDPNKRQIEKSAEIVEQINSLESKYEAFSEQELCAQTYQFRSRLAQGESLDDILPEAYAVVREASKRTLGQRHYDVQLIGGIALHQGKIAEMRTGEGKTLVATLPLYLNALALNPAWLELAQQKWGTNPDGWSFVPLEGQPVGRGAHLITVNDYLARRDARWMGPIYNLLGLNVGVLQMAARTENGKKAFLVDFERQSPHEDQQHLRMVPRAEAYAADVTYGTNSEFGFDYLRDNMTLRLEDRVQRGHTYAIIDEADNVLIDEARTPLIISGPAQDESAWYIRMAQVVKNLKPEDYEVNERDRTVTLTEVGESHVESLLDIPLRDPERPEDVTPEQARLLGYLEQALRSQFLFKRNKDYLVQAGKVIIIDEFTGRLMPGRRWSDGLHQAVEAKEGARVQSENVTYATITIQNYFRMYEKLAGMTGTALTESEEFSKIYNLEVLAIPTNLEFIAASSDSSLTEIEDRDEQGYKYQYYTQRNDHNHQPVFWKRKDYPDVVYRTEDAKLRAITMEILRYHVQGRPLLVGTTSVELSERLSNRLRAEPIRRLAQVLLLRSAWMEAHQREEDGRIIPELQFLSQSLDQLQVSDMRKLARELELSVNPESPENIERLVKILDLRQADKTRLNACMQAGIAHQVLNARKHTEESQIIAGAGAFGAVTIATNMAGRGVDIKLGGELAEEIIAAVNRVLRKAGYENPFDMKLEERQQALLGMNPADYGIYEAEVKRFLQHMAQMQMVKELGGLHVIGSERHEARRIDNQLRGRSARQGDPGSSRFYLSMEDELMRLFGGQQADGLMQRLKIDDAMPLELGLVSRLVEQAQTRVEGSNFDIRKHLLEYDDVLNTQRAKIYAQRNRIFTKQDLTDDVTEMLQSEVTRRVPLALQDEEGAWKLLAWLDQIQPSFSINGSIFPSYTIKLLTERLKADLFNKEAHKEPLDTTRLMASLLKIAEEALQAEAHHIQHAITHLLESMQDRFESQVSEHLETLQAFLSSLEDADESDTRTPRQLLEELSASLHLPLKLSPEEMRALREAPQELEDILRSQVENMLRDQAVTRLHGAVERRLEEDLELDRSRLIQPDWESVSDVILSAIDEAFKNRYQRLIGNNADGQIARDLEAIISKLDFPINEGQLMGLLLQIPQGARASFDKRTHQRVWHRTTRLTYVYAVGQILENREPEEIAADVLKHLETAQSALRFAWGQSEWQRLSGNRPLDWDGYLQMRLLQLFGQTRYNEIAGQPLLNLSNEERSQVISELGRSTLTEVYRQLLLGVITELWVEYLTSMEALRVSIGLEAYAQRDPLVQYKNRAFEMFQELLSNMRLGVVNRMFTYRPREITSQPVPVSVSRPEAVPVPIEQRQVSQPASHKRKRRRH